MPAIVAAAIGALPLIVNVIQGWMDGDTQATLDQKWEKVVAHFEGSAATWRANVAARDASKQG